MRLTKKEIKHLDIPNGAFINETSYDVDVFDRPNAIYKLGELEDIEDEIGVELIKIYKALEHGIYWKDHHSSKISRCKPSNLILDWAGLYDDSTGKCLGVYNKYGKEWALTEEELEDANE